MALSDVFLLSFEAVSELRANLSKTELVPTGVMKLGLVLGFRVVTLPMIYLGLLQVCPLGHNQIGKKSLKR